MQEKLERDRQENLRKVREAAKAREENTRTSQTDAGGASPGMGDFYQFLNDPEVLQAFQVSVNIEKTSQITFKTIMCGPRESRSEIMLIM